MTKDGKGKKGKGGKDHGEPAGVAMSKADYLAALEPLELALNNLARWLQHTGRRLAVVFEGRDTAGKGGAIAAVAETLNPRQCHVVALGKPSEREQAQWYFQRHVPHLPAAGEITLFDRSWYNRAGVERVMGYCSEAQALAFLQQTPVFERMLVDDGLILLKYWLTVDQAEQEKRLAERLDDPLKRWKLSPIDLQARDKYAAYGKARDAMLKATHTDHAPWTLVDFNDQRRGRIALIRHLLAQVPDTHTPPEPLQLPPLPAPPLTERLPRGFRAI
ncbi:MAG TPA: polyphosphate kinase 2 [Aquabacterium sp.]|nr:polyphosphate kinase 2 [Aquabacterium sp.]HQC97236.1 polyphosphate kinase 2 [Aquabacterium sp.]